ncbi:MAG: phosphoribosyltransferase [Candidatus Heimdallarchaeota archaeon]|nr:phosphoribosyltransferase [Candidatus Heimdallarchaeota archaeon]
MVEYLVQNWQDAFDKCFSLYLQIKTADYVPDMIVGIARGGWVPARLLADFMGTKNTLNIKVEAYELIGETDVEAKITQDITSNIEGKSILVVDDIADTGSSLEVVIESLVAKKVKDYRIATLYYKDKSSIIPDFYCQLTSAWVVFPWEIFETLSELRENLASEGKSVDEMKSQFREIGLPPQLIESYFNHY